VATATKSTVNNRNAASSWRKKKLLKDMSTAKMITQASRQFWPSPLTARLPLVETRKYLARELKQAMTCNPFFMIRRHVIHGNEPFIPSEGTSVIAEKPTIEIDYARLGAGGWSPTKQ
jgi:hypothetical protein